MTGYLKKPDLIDQVAQIRYDLRQLEKSNPVYGNVEDLPIGLWLKTGSYSTSATFETVYRRRIRPIYQELHFRVGGMGESINDSGEVKVEVNGNILLGDDPEQTPGGVGAINRSILPNIPLFFNYTATLNELTLDPNFSNDVEISWRRTAGTGVVYASVFDFYGVRGA